MSAPPYEVDFRGLMEPVARYFLGEPNRALSTRDELRWGSNGSMSVKLSTDQFYDHEAGVGGGVVRFVEHTQAWEHSTAVGWLRENHPDRFPAAPAKTNGAGTHRPTPAKAADKLGVFEKAYDYVDEHGELLFQAVRYRDPKTFRQRRPKPGGGWIPNIDGVRLVPYRLPEVLAAIAKGRPILIVEGERDADRLWVAGLPATCNPMGANHWTPELNQYFKGADVTVIGDHDPQATNKKTGKLRFHPDGRPIFPGQEHADDVARQLAPVAGRVRLLRDLGDAWAECPPKGDVSDYLDSGKNVADLMALIEPLPDYGPALPTPALIGAFTAADLHDKLPPARVWHVVDLIPARTVSLLGGDGGVGKSILGLQLAFATAAGLPWIGQHVRQGRALHLSAEDDRDELHRRTDAISKFYGTPLDQAPGLTMWSLADEDAVLVTGHSGEALQPTARWEELRRYIELDRPALIIFDSLADVYGGNENERAQVRQFVRLLRGLVMPFDGAVVLLGHPSLTGLSTGSGLSGSTAWNNSVRSRMFMSAPVAEDGGASEPNLRTLAVKKANYAQAGAELRLRYVAGAFANDDVEEGSAIDRQVLLDRIDSQFLQLLDAYEADERVVSDRTGRNYAPFLFAADPRARGTNKTGFEAAMNRLFAAHRIRVAIIGRGKHERRTLVRVQT